MQFLKRNETVIDLTEKSNKPDIVNYGRNDNKNLFFVNGRNINQQSRALRCDHNFLIESVCSIRILQLRRTP